MLTFAPNLHIYLHTQPTDMRKSFDGLSGLVRSVFQADPTNGSLFLFLNRRRDRLKILWWDRDGLALFYKPTNPTVGARRGAPSSCCGLPTSRACWRSTLRSWPCC